MATITPYRSGQRPGPDGFAQLVRAEWTKFRTVRGWILGLIVAVVVAAGFGLLTTGASGTVCQRTSNGPAHCRPAPQPSFPLGPGGEPVSDSFYFVHQPLAGNGTITVRVTSLTGLVPAANLNTPSPTLRPGTEQWAKAGIIIKQSLKPGSEYAAMMVAARHGVRMQWNYTADRPGLPGTVGPANPRWLRLTRAGDVITGYDSADGTHWVKAGAVTLHGLPSTVQVGLFAASPDHNPEVQHLGGGIQGGGGPTRATAVIDHVSGFRGPWAGTYIGAASESGIGAANASGIGRYHQAGGRFTVTGSGDIAPVPAGNGGPAATAATVGGYLLGTFAGLIALAVVATMFMTAEYRRNLIRVTLAASPRRGRALAAKAVVIGAVAFVTGLAGAGIAVLAGTAVTHARGTYQFPVTGLTEARLIIATGVLAAVSAVFALAVGSMVRRGAVAVTIVIVTVVLPYFLSLAAVVPSGAADWLLRITPAAGFAVQAPYPRYPQVSVLYSVVSGYYPLGPWTGLAVLCGWTAVALTGAAVLLRRRDA
jgi:ABC-type transport system involved in multi-copper enzyme maturation permease subunit/regulation of enolase protein 1 (concanavalin A-like superfamily)